MATRLSIGRPTHLLLTDSVMPEIGGAELAGGSQWAHPGIPVLYMSGDTGRPRVPFRSLLQVSQSA
jgi:DNA-binding NtrC family response regulator